MPLFQHYIAIDYSGAETPTSPLKGLRVFVARGDDEPHEAQPPTKRYWTRKAVAEYLHQQLSTDAKVLVGIDHGFSFPVQYFQRYGQTSYDQFLDDFCAHWPTDEDHVYVDFVRDGFCGKGAERTGSSKWRRLCEVRARAKSVFHFDCPGSVAKSTHAGLPWLRGLGKAGVHRWPFDGWQATGSVVAEVYPALWKGRYIFDGTPNQQDAYSICRWLQETDWNGELPGYFAPALTDDERGIAELEGWILGLR